MEICTESSGVDTSPDMNSSADLTPDRMPHPRKLFFGSSPESGNNISQSNLILSPKKDVSMSPPYRKVRALRLFDTPATPKTILKKLSVSEARNAAKDPDRSRGEADFMDVLARPIDYHSSSTPLQLDRVRPRVMPLHLHNLSFDQKRPSANINPFTPDGMLMKTKKRTRFELSENHNHSLPPRLGCDGGRFSDDDSYEMRQAPKRLALQDTNISRYEREFVQLSLIGAGEFGHVFKCLNRLDGCIYAIKKSKKPIEGSVSERIALNEVWAHAVLGKHDNVVRYYSAWAENNHMLIQNEYCNGGSLQSLLQTRHLNESELRILLIHITEGLRYIHSSDLVHMDLKAGNIFLTKAPQRLTAVENPDDGFEDIIDETERDVITYKIGDLGHVTSVMDPQVEEGDCRYLPAEILLDDFTQLPKADIFSLGITLYEAGGGGPLPKNGPEWHRLRDGNIPELPGLSSEFNNLIKLMTHPDPKQRPSPNSIFNHPLLCLTDTKSKAQLSMELSMERQKNELLMKELKETKRILKSYEMSKTPNTISVLPVSKRMKSNASPFKCDRQLRSYSKNKRISSVRKSARNFRDRNKNIIDF
ncbi:wee1-like protein kinase [Phlebotomus argentipes]|uniref:wee1-like protein kinase n=1 Tax=Phlebotomus argentipes TaxID=94469 RepID=UPI002892B007|nr:wee1-like protein kinase [Phlebotomus argentipes]